jgi:hypothetical protein
VYNTLPYIYVHLFVLISYIRVCLSVTQHMSCQKVMESYNQFSIGALRGSKLSGESTRKHHSQVENN